MKLTDEEKKEFFEIWQMSFGPFFEKYGHRNRDQALLAFFEALLDKKLSEQREEFVQDLNEIINNVVEVGESIDSNLFDYYEENLKEILSKYKAK